ncbi:MAG: LysR family transcriptional regulator, partial [Acidimicrobiales bacterium]
MDWTARQLRAIVAIAERRNISHAAVELGLTQPTVSRMLSRVESDLGLPLFDRDAKGATPTEAGVRFVERAGEALRSLDDVTDEIRSLEGRLVGKICVAMPDTVGHSLFIPLIDRFATLHPDVELRVMAAHPNGVPLALVAGDADVGVVSSAHKDDGLITTPLANEHLHFVGAAPSHRRARRPRAATAATVAIETV